MYSVGSEEARQLPHPKSRKLAALQPLEQLEQMPLWTRGIACTAMMKPSSTLSAERSRGPKSEWAIVLFHSSTTFAMDGSASFPPGLIFPLYLLDNSHE